MRSTTVSQPFKTPICSLREQSTAARIALVVVAMAVLAGFAAQGQAAAETAPRWERAMLTVHIADEAAWAGTDVAGVLEQWAPAMPLVLTDDPDADVVLAGHGPETGVEGATATREGSGSRITSCRVTLADRYVGADQGGVLAHELGHCLGLSHNNGGESSVMYWIEGGEHFSPTVTVADINNVEGMYR